MKRVEAAHRYDVPVERGFAFITDTANWSKFWPGYVRLEEGSSWGAPGDTARLMTRLLGRERELTMTITAFEPNRLVTYTSTQPGLPTPSMSATSSPTARDSSTGSSSSTSRAAGIAGSSTGCCSTRGIRRAFREHVRCPGARATPAAMTLRVLIVGASGAGM